MSKIYISLRVFFFSVFLDTNEVILLRHHIYRLKTLILFSRQFFLQNRVLCWNMCRLSISLKADSILSFWDAKLFLFHQLPPSASNQDASKQAKSPLLPCTVQHTKSLDLPLSGGLNFTTTGLLFTRMQTAFSSSLPSTSTAFFFFFKEKNIY